MSLTIKAGSTAYFNILNTRYNVGLTAEVGAAGFYEKVDYDDGYPSFNGTFEKQYWQNSQDLIGVESIDFNTNTNIAIPPHSEGRLVYDWVNKCHTAYNDNTSVGLCIGREFFARVKNNSGSTINNGQAVYINSAESGIPTIELADKNDFTKSRLIGLATADIGNGAISYVTLTGTVNDLNTSSFTLGEVLYLGDNGNLTSTRPTDGDFPVTIGVVTDVHATTGKIYVLPDIPQYTAEVVKVTGWANVSQRLLTFDDGTRLLTLSPEGTEFRFYENGVKYEKTTDSITISDVEGLHYVYYDEGTLVDLANPSFDQIAVIIRTKPSVAYVYWDATNGKAIYLGNEEHTISMPGATHLYLHVANGAVYVSGLNATDVLVDQSGGLDTHAQFGIAAGSIADEDVPTFMGGVTSTVGLPIYYLTGPEASYSVRQIINSGFSVATTGTGRLAYNQLTGGNYQLTEVGDNSHVLCHVFGINDIDDTRKLISFVGFNSYSTITEAEQGAADEVNFIRSSGRLSVELVPLYSFVFNTKNTYGNAVKARIVSISDGDFFDWRSSGVTGGGGGGGGGIVTPVFADNIFTIFHFDDITKELAFDVSPVDTSTKRTIGAPNHNLKLPLLDSASGDVVETDGAGQQQYRGTGLKSTTINTATYTVLATDEALMVDYDGLVTITWPSALITSAKKTWYVVDRRRNATLYNIVLETEGSQTINGYPNFKIAGDNDALQVHSDASNLFLV